MSQNTASSTSSETIAGHPNSQPCWLATNEFPQTTKIWHCNRCFASGRLWKSFLRQNERGKRGSPSLEGSFWGCPKRGHDRRVAARSLRTIAQRPNYLEIGRSLSTDPTRSVTSICEHLGISRPTYYRYIRFDLNNIAETNAEWSCVVGVELSSLEQLSIPLVYETLLETFSPWGAYAPLVHIVLGHFNSKVSGGFGKNLYFGAVCFISVKIGNLEHCKHCKLLHSVCECLYYYY